VLRRKTVFTETVSGSLECETRALDPSKATAMEVTDYLLCLNQGGLFYKTINVHGSAIFSTRLITDGVQSEQHWSDWRAFNFKRVYLAYTRDPPRLRYLVLGRGYDSEIPSDLGAIRSLNLKQLSLKPILQLMAL